MGTIYYTINHDDVIKWKHFTRYWPFVRGIHRSPVNSPHKGQLRRALMFSLIRAWINGRVNNRKAGDLRRNPAYYDVIKMFLAISWEKVINPVLKIYCLPKKAYEHLHNNWGRFEWIMSKSILSTDGTAGTRWPNGTFAPDDIKFVAYRFRLEHNGGGEMHRQFDTRYWR